MNRRTLKKKCKRAMEILIAEHGYQSDAFSLSDGGESVDAPQAMEKRYVRHGFLDPGPLKGTPLLWERTSYEYDEWDAFLPVDRLNEIQAWESVRP